MSQPKILEVNSLCKTYKSVEAVSDISFSMEQGDIFAFLGPNGAGKTTTLRMILDIIKPDSGTIQWGLKTTSDYQPLAGQIGYLPEERGLYTDLPVIRSLVYLASIRGMDPARAKSAAMEWLEKLELADRAKEKLQTLSKGNQQKIQFIASILHQPRFAILDEPFSGLDPLNQEKFIEYIKEINARGTTILLSAHQMQLIEKIATKIFLINRGKQIYYGSLSGIFKEYGGKHILDITFKEDALQKLVQNLRGVESFTWENDRNVRITFNHNIDLNIVLSELSQLGGIADITSRKPDLHDIFVQLVKNHQISQIRN